MLRLMVATPAALACAAASVLALTACTGGSSPPAGSTTGSPAVTATSALGVVDAQAVGRAMTSEATLAAAVRADLDRFGRRVSVLRPVAMALDAHVVALQRATSSSEGPPLVTTPPPAVTPAAALRHAVAGLRVAAVTTSRQVVGQRAPVTGPVAGLLGSVAASDTALAAVVGGGTAGPGVAGPRVTPSVGSSLGALQTALAGEYAAIYAYGVVGGQLAAHAAPTSQLDRARAGLDVHSARRDQLIVMIQAAGGAADPGAGGYALPFPVASAASARRLAALVEARCAGNYAQVVVGSVPASSRGASLAWLRDAAVQQSAWTGVAPVLPGLQQPPPTP